MFFVSLLFIYVFKEQTTTFKLFQFSVQSKTFGKLFCWYQPTSQLTSKKIRSLTNCPLISLRQTLDIAHEFSKSIRGKLFSTLTGNNHFLSFTSVFDSPRKTFSFFFFLWRKRTLFSLIHALFLRDSSSGHWSFVTCLKFFLAFLFSLKTTWSE